MVIKDYRYVYHAIIVHTIWGLVWFTITAPVFYTGYKLRSLSFYPKVNVDDSEGKIGEENNISNSIEGAIGSLNFIGSIIAACITFVAPILKSSIFG